MAGGYWRIGEDNTEKIVDADNEEVYYKTKPPYNVTVNSDIVTNKAILLDFDMANYWDLDASKEKTILFSGENELERKNI